VVDGLKAKYEGKVEFRILNVETDQQANQLANSMGVTAVPTFIFVNSNGIEAGRQVGTLPEAQLVQTLDALQ